eukprot:jgi/Mesvir1/13457/Mv16516-RA.1
MATSWIAAIAAILALSVLGHADGFCTPGSACWPTAAQLAALSAKLSPEANRTLSWAGPGNPYPTAIPASLDGENNQPMWGFFQSTGLQPIYAEDVTAQTGTCFEDGTFDPYCVVTARNAPHEGWQPAFTAFPLTWQHIQELVLFATAHDLKVCVAGTGHDFLNRHSCDDGLLIRTIFLKGAEFDLTDAKGLGSPSVRLGAGMVFGEAHKAAAEQNRFLSSGWAATVGVVGWSLGGGHGPMAPSRGLGVDNILEIELIAANGDRVRANALGTYRQRPNSTEWTHSTSSELWLAMRGGGGSTWGVVTAITLRVHNIPAGGFTRVTAMWEGSYCGAGETALHALLDGYLEWAQTLDTKWGGLFFLTPVKDEGACAARWSVVTKYYFQGSINEEGVRDKWQGLRNISADYRTEDTEESFPNWWEIGKTLGLEPIIPLANYYAPRPEIAYGGGVPSVMLSRAVIANGTVAPLLKRHMGNCKTTDFCSPFEIYNDITGNLGSLDAVGAGASNVSISSGFRSALLHLVFTIIEPSSLDEVYALGANSYFSESAYDLTDWKTRYYGDKYARLEAVKTAMDPDNRLTCHHCVEAAGTASPPPPPPRSPPPVSRPPPPRSAAEGLRALAQIGVALAALVFSLSLLGFGY